MSSNGVKKSNFSALTSIPDGATLDFVSGGTNYKITKSNFISNLGVTGTIVQDGSVTGTPVLDVAGTVNQIRNLESGSGVITSVSPENGITLSHNFTQEGTGVAIVDGLANASPTFRSLIAGTGVTITDNGDGTVEFEATGEFISSKTVLVSDLSDLPDPVSNVITLDADTEYSFLNDISLGINRIVLQERTTIIGADKFNIALTYTGTGDMFSGTDGDNFMKNITINAPSGTLFNFTVPTAKSNQIQDVDYSCATVGSYSGTGGTVVHTRFSGTNTTNGITFSGNFSSLAVFQSNIGIDAGTRYNLGTATFDNVKLRDLIVRLEAGSTFISGLTGSGNINANQLGSIQGCSFIVSAGTVLNGITETDIKWVFDSNDAISDTRIDGLNWMQGNATATVIAVATTPVLVAGTFTPVLADQSKMTAIAAGRITLDTITAARLPISFTVSAAPVSGGAQTIAAYVAINGSVITGSKRTASVASGGLASISGIWQYDFQPTDYLEIFVANDTGTTDVLVSSAILRVN